MNHNDARTLLELDENIVLNEIILKRQYRLMALRYHPDKNKSADAAERFHKITDAFEYLKKNCDDYENESIYDDNDNENENDYANEFYQKHFDKSDYKYLLFCFFKSLIKGDSENITENREYQSVKRKIMTIITTMVSDVCENKALDLCKCVDKNLLKNLFYVLKKYKDTFHLTDRFVNEVENILNKKYEDLECIILNPFIEDLLNDNVYKLKYCNDTYIIPLWHDELVYECNGNEFYVKCIPILPDRMWLDEHNNVNVELECILGDLFGKEELYIPIGQKDFKIFIKDIRLVKKQTIVLYGLGISKINTKQIYDNSNRSDIIIHLYLSM